MAGELSTARLPAAFGRLTVYLSSTRLFVVDDSAYGISGAPPCRTDYIEFFDSADHNGASLGKHCTLEVPDPVRISTDGARVVFQGRRNSNRPANRVGTKVFYYIDGELNYLAYTYTYLSSSV